MLVASEVAARPGVETVPTVEFDMPSVVIVAPDDGSQFGGARQAEMRLQREVAPVRPHGVEPGLAGAGAGIERELARCRRRGALLAAGRIAGFGSSTRPEVRSIRIASR